MELSILNTQKNMNNTNTSANNVVKAEEKKLMQQPRPDHAVKCPRCDSGNTKFCYYNNYSLSQPRYFCKACRRYWTEGGTLRNVPVGGGCRKNKRSAKRVLESHRHHLLVQSQVENVLSYDDGNLPLSNFSSGTGDSLSLAFARLQKQCDGNNLGFEFNPQNSVLGIHQQGPVFGNPVTGSNLLDHNPHQQIRSSANLGFLSNFFQTQTTSSLASQQSLYNYGFEIGGGQNHQSHTQPLLPNEVLSLSTMAMAETGGGFSLMSGLKQEMICNKNGLNDNRNNNFWQMDCNISSSENNNLVLGSNFNNVGNGYEVAGGREIWNNTGLAATQSWPNLIDSASM
ncbi:hypothetical protein QQ045_033202 [Rhodiola kirilowii]